MHNYIWVVKVHLGSFRDHLWAKVMEDRICARRWNIRLHIELEFWHRERWHVSICGPFKHLIAAVYLVTPRVHARWFLPVARAKVEAESTNLHTNQRRFNGPIIGFLSTSLCFSFSLGKVMSPVCVCVCVAQLMSDYWKMALLGERKAFKWLFIKRHNMHHVPICAKAPDDWCIQKRV